METHRKGTLSSVYSSKRSKKEQYSNMATTQLMIGSITMVMLLSVVYAGGYGGYDEDPGYDCYPNGTITIPNPKPAIFNSVIATYNDGYNIHMCLVSGTETIVITNCNWTFWIDVVFSKQSNMSRDIMMAGDVKACRIKCNQITEHYIGFNKTLGVTLPVTVKQPVTPSYSISAGFYNRSIEGSPIYTATIGDTIDFTMMGPMEYYLRPLKCIAYNNPSKASSTSNKTLVEDGCTMDYKLIGDFTRSEAGGYFQYTAMFSVFRFYQSSDLYIECSVKVCPQAEECEYSCMEPYRKRRQASEARDKLGHDARIATIGRRLRIEGDLMGGSTQIQGCGWLSVLLYIVLVV